MYQSSTGAWHASRSSSYQSVSNKPAAVTTPIAETIVSKRKKGKQRQNKHDPVPTPEPTAIAAEESQSKGPLGAPVLSTSDPQILEEEAEEEDPTFKVGESTPDDIATGGQENTEHNTTSSYFGADNDEFRNVWGSDRV